MIYFFQELDILRLQMNELKDIVYKFIIVEYPFGYDREPRSMHFAENRGKFREFDDKIIHIIDNNDYTKKTGIQLFWARKQSPVLMNSLLGCKDDDFIIIIDDDVVLEKKAFDNIDLSRQTQFYLRWCLYFYNLICLHAGQAWAISAPYWIIKKTTIGKMVGYEEPGQEIQKIGECGWHFAKTGGVDKIRENILSYPHQEYKLRKDLLDPKAIQFRIDNKLGWTSIIGKP